LYFLSYLCVAQDGAGGAAYEILGQQITIPQYFCLALCIQNGMVRNYSKETEIQKDIGIILG